ncbi:serine/threonine-protein kinase [Massilia sp. MS-15]|uniref:serine/threonine-protein kinase n=1 Tax=Massilia sp. MS-15 TaxID=2878200 RepID=UPI001CD328C0|nr:serine/threonine-protein kinase [Massilia sp. MS-15]MCA1245706.1 serine/threonine-protein kinase [Massilia sp. MS-15]
MSTSPEDDRTVLSSAPPPAPTAVGAHERSNALPPGTRLGEFEITGILGEGGFGIVYLAYDSSLERQVALKEYMPSFAARSTEVHVSVRSAQNAESYEAGLRSFVNEARLLAQFDHPSLVKVYRFWEANGTAYMVMPYYRGTTLKQTLKDLEAAPDETWLQQLLAPLLDALDQIHQHQCFHRDIAPDNILMLEEGRPLLLDFGAARRAIGDMNQAFTVILKQNYAPIEQYAEMPGMRQGPWTDLYALASVVHFAIDGRAPPPAVSRMMADPYVPLAARYGERYSGAFLEAIDRALAFRPEDRPQDVAALRALLGLDTMAVRTAPPHAVPPAAPPPAAPAPDPDRPHPRSDIAQPARAAPRGRAMLLGAGAALVLGAAGWWAYSGMQGKASGAQAGKAAETVPPRVAAAAAPPASALQQAPAPAPAPAAAAAPATARAPAPAPAALTPAAALDAVMAGASPERQVSVRVENPRLRINRDKIRFSVRSSHAGFVYVYMVGAQGNNFELLFPNAVDRKNRIGAGATLDLPRPRWALSATGPEGTDRLLVMVSDSPRDFSATGMATEGDVSTFPFARAAELLRRHTGAAPLYAGTPVCLETPCPGDYGAAAFTVEQVRE